MGAITEVSIHFHAACQSLQAVNRVWGFEQKSTWNTQGFRLLVGCLMSQQHASVSQGRICSDNLTCCHTETEVADQTFYLALSQCTDTGPTSPSADPITPGAWQGSHWSANFLVTGMTRPRKKSGASGIRTRDLLLSRRTPYHKANEAVEHAGKGKRPPKSSLQAEQQHNVKSAGTSSLMSEKSEGPVIAVLASALWMNDAPRSIKE